MMPPPHPTSVGAEAQAKLLETLIAASAEERRYIVLTLIAGGDGRLPVQEDATEDHSWQSTHILRSTRTRTLTNWPKAISDVPPIDLRQAVLRGVNLDGVDLRSVNLAGASLQGSVLRGADLRGVCLESADLSGADLAGAKFDGAAMEKADFSETTCEDASFNQSSLRFVRAKKGVFEGADLRAAELWGADLSGAVLTDVDLRGAVIIDADFRGADLSRARFAGASVGPANFDDAVLTGADLRGASLSEVSLRRAVLTNARLSGVTLTGCTLDYACLAGAALDDTQLDRIQVRGVVGEELAGDYSEAARAYLTLERCFNANGDQTAVSWAYRKRRRMQKHAAYQRGRGAWRLGQWGEAAHEYSVYIADVAAEWLCDYGESVPRVLATMVVVYLSFMFMYMTTGSIVRVEPSASGSHRVPTSSLTDASIFSLMAMTTSGSPAVVLQPASERVHALTGVQALLGIALTGLLGFVLGNRIRR